MNRGARRPPARDAQRRRHGGDGDLLALLDRGEQWRHGGMAAGRLVAGCYSFRVMQGPMP